ncbi:MAG: hypothetical protein E7520_04390 [Ruminococcaceae bacterium]|nr:hypothetical protein [Oscillospiraceae bacterium]
MTELLRKQTDELLNELKQKNIDIQDYINHNENSFIEINLRTMWEELFKKSNKSKSDIINNADISYIYFYEILQGKKIPTKDKIVRLILAMELSLDDCQMALKYCNHSQLYPRIKRDSLIIYAIENKLNLYDLQELLNSNGEKELK